MHFSSVLSGLLSQQETLTPELQRTAKWMVDHSEQVGFVSMRHIAREVGVAPTTVLRLAKALGFSDFSTLKQAFQHSLVTEIGYKNRAISLQTQQSQQANQIDGADGAEGTSHSPNTLLSQLTEAQLNDVEANQIDNPAALFQHAIADITAAKTVAFLGMRTCYGVAFQFFYAYNLIYDNGMLLQNQAGTFFDHLDHLGKGDVLIAISLSPYSTLTVEAVEAAAKAGVTIVALTDSPLSPIARHATHVLRFRAETVSFFHSMVGCLSLIEQLLAQLAVQGGSTVLERLDHVERSLIDRHAYWNHRDASRGKKPLL